MVQRLDNPEDLMRILARHIVTAPMSYRAIAAAAGCSVSSVADLANAQSQPRLGTAIRIANALGFTLWFAAPAAAAMIRQRKPGRPRGKRRALEPRAPGGRATRAQAGAQAEERE